MGGPNGLDVCTDRVGGGFVRLREWNLLLSVASDADVEQKSR